MIAVVEAASLALPSGPDPVTAYLASLGPGSRRAQLSALTQVARWAGFSGPWVCPWASWSYEHQAGLRGRLSEGFAPAYANRVLGAVRGVVGAAWRLGLLDGETAARVRSVPGVAGSRLPPGRALTAGELERLFRACDGATAAAMRDTALLALLAGGGLRIHEPCGLQLEGYDARSGVVRLVGKGNREREVPLATGAAQKIAPWLEVRGQEPGPLLWHVTSGDRPVPRPLAPRGAGRAVERIAERAGVELSSHDFRRTLASLLLDQGEDLLIVGGILGHARPQTTARYDRRPAERRREAMRRVSL